MFRKLKKQLRLLLGLRNDTDYYAQGGEDAIVSKTFAYLLPVQKGFYVDIGAYHPFQHSNTYLLYKSGWRGINIDPRPGSKDLFDKYRKGDINIEAGIASQNGKMTYYILKDAATMNTFSRKNLEKLNLLDRVKATVDIPVYTYETMLKQYNGTQSVDYLNIDAEGFEMDILTGINFERSAPKVISIEQNDILSLSDVLSTPVALFLKEKKYTAFAKNLLVRNISTVFYIRDEYTGGSGSS